MQDLLNAFNQSAGEVQGSAVFSVDGIMFASTLAYDENPDEVGAIVAAMQSLGGKTAHLLRRGHLQEIYIHGAKGHMVISALNDETLLIVLMHNHANVGLILHEIQRLRKKFLDLGLMAEEHNS